MSRQLIATLQKKSNVVWMKPTPDADGAQRALAKTHPAYYRTQIFTAHCAINPLVAAAYPLLTLATRLCASQSCENLIDLHQMLLHEVRVFENQAQQKNYRHSIITIASYLLCVLMDETIMATDWGKHWHDYSLFTAFHHQVIEQDQVFPLLDRLLQHPQQHLDVIELAYLCLSFGLKNPQLNHPSPEFLEKLDRVYRCIRDERGEISQGFLVKSNQYVQIKSNKIDARWWLPMTLLGSFSVITMAYLVYSHGLKVAAMPLVQSLLPLSGHS